MGTVIELKYADDICWIRANHANGIDHYRENIPEQLAERNLEINQKKNWRIYDKQQEWRLKKI